MKQLPAFGSFFLLSISKASNEAVACIWLILKLNFNQMELNFNSFRN